MSWPQIIERLQAGEDVTIRPRGQSMTPRIKSKQEVTISPIGDTEIVEGLVVLARVKGRHYLHLVSAVDGNRVQISNNHGWVNGWTTRDKVYGVVSAIGNKKEPVQGRPLH